MTGTIRLLRLALPAAVLSAAAPALAQGRDPGWTISIGPGAYMRPEFPGARDLELRPWPVIDIRRAGTDPIFETPDEGFGFGIIGDEDFRIGPAFQIEHGRDEDDAIPGIGDVGTTIEGGAFAEYYVAPGFRLRGEVRKGFGGHKGVVADLGGDVIFGTPAEGLNFSIGPRLRLANARYVRAFFGVNPEQSALTGLPVHNVDGGLHSAGALAFANYQFNRRWGIQGYARYARLLGDAKDSPLVLSSVGSRNQYEVGIGLSFSFDILGD